MTSSAAHIVPKVQAMRWTGDALALLDQRQLPGREVWLEIGSVDAAITAIADLVVRGAPAIGIAAAYAGVLAARDRADDIDAWVDDMRRLEAARPTAVNLRWAVQRLLAAREHGAGEAALESLARRIHEEDQAANRAMAAAGAALIEADSGVLTHCNTGSLATGGVGTALGVIVAAWQGGRLSAVFADETRPWLQGSRLTAWECAREGVPCRIIVEGAAAALMASGKVHWVITGADRIAANGDVVNKIGTYSLAVLARHHGVRFMVVAPWSTVDLDTARGDDVPIEERDASEIWRAAGMNVPAGGTSAWNPVFDVTPAELITAIVTEKGIVTPPFAAGLEALSGA